MNQHTLHEKREQFLYSDTLNLVRARLQQQARTLLRSHGIFCDPLPEFQVLIFRGGRRLLGFYQPQPHRICLREALVYGNHEAALEQVLRHELAHMAAYLYDAELGHGPAFRAWCRRLSIPATAGCRLEGVLAEAQVESLIAADMVADSASTVTGGPRAEAQRLALRVKKLLALGSSPNRHEAELATAKANQLLQQYNLSLLGQHNLDEFRLHAVEAWSGRRLSSAVKIISGLLGEFFYVFPLIEPGEGNRRLLLYGEQANLEIAEYVFEYLLRVFQELRREHGVSRSHGGGEVAFYAGLGEGLADKLRAAQAPAHPKPQTPKPQTLAAAEALVVFRRRTEELTSRLVFDGSLRTHRARGSRYRKNELYSAGRKAGAGISIHPGIRGDASPPRLPRGT